MTGCRCPSHSVIISLQNYVMNSIHYRNTNIPLQVIVMKRYNMERINRWCTQRHFSFTIALQSFWNYFIWFTLHLLLHLFSFFSYFFFFFLALLNLDPMRSFKDHFACLLLIDWLAPIFFCKLYISVLHLKPTFP